jgi:hypothetical protein
MALSQVALNTQVVSEAYHQAILFDKMKRKKEEASAGADKEKAEEKKIEPTLLEELPPREKPKPNTVPFKTGFTFDYGHGSDNGPITISITDKEKVKVELKNGQDPEGRKRTIRSLVMLGLGKINRQEFNDLFVQGKNKIESIREELALMGLKTDVPFGLADQSFYITGSGLVNAYKPMDIKG